MLSKPILQAFFRLWALWVRWWWGFYFSPCLQDSWLWYLPGIYWLKLVVICFSCWKKLTWNLGGTRQKFSLEFFLGKNPYCSGSMDASDGMRDNWTAKFHGGRSSMWSASLSSGLLYHGNRRNHGLRGKVPWAPDSRWWHLPLPYMSQPTFPPA